MVTPKTTPFLRRAHETDRTYLHLLINFPFHGVSWFSASFIFWRSTFFLHLCHFLLYLCQYLRWGENRSVSEAGPFQSCRTACVRREKSPGEVDAAVAGSRCPVESAIFCLVFLHGLSASWSEPFR